MVIFVRRVGQYPKFFELGANSEPAHVANYYTSCKDNCNHCKEQNHLEVEMPVNLKLVSEALLKFYSERSSNIEDCTKV